MYNISLFMSKAKDVVIYLLFTAFQLDDSQQRHPSALCAGTWSSNIIALSHIAIGCISVFRGQKQEATIYIQYFPPHQFGLKIGSKILQYSLVSGFFKFKMPQHHIHIIL